MGWLADLVGWVPAQERRGIQVDVFGPHWELAAPQGLPALFRALDGWLPDGSVLYFEDGLHSPEVTAFMRAHAVPERAHLEMGTIWPRPSVYHLPASPEVFARLVDLAENHAAPELAIHLHAYLDDEVLVQGYDILAQELWLSPTLPEQRVRDLAIRLGVVYRREGDRP
jgi:hypothetical protein